MKIFFGTILLFSMKLFAQPMVDSNYSQNILRDVQLRQNNTSKMSMSSLTGWAAGNMIVSGIAMGQTQGQVKYFNQMNLFWNVVNLGIGVPGLIGTFKKKSMNFQVTVKAQSRYEKIYLFNAGLDIGYVATGWALNNFGKTKSGDLGERFKGYGNSLVLQGAYLFIHDIINYFVYKTNNKRLDLIWKDVRIEPTLTGMVIHL